MQKTYLNPDWVDGPRKERNHVRLDAASFREMIHGVMHTCLIWQVSPMWCDIRPSTFCILNLYNTCSLYSIINLQIDEHIEIAF